MPKRVTTETKIGWPAQMMVWLEYLACEYGQRSKKFLDYTVALWL